MKSVTGNYKECVVSYNKVTEDGLEKKVKDTFVVNALSFTEAEAKINKEMSSYISGAFQVININPAQYGEVFFCEDEIADRWYKAKLQFITIDESTEKEKRTNIIYLVQANTFEQARKNIDSVMNGTMIDYVIAKIEETKLVDVFVER